MKPNHHWIFPDSASDDTVVALSTFLRNLASECERRYAVQLDRHRAGQLSLFDSEQPWITAPRQTPGRSRTNKAGHQS